MKQKYIHLFFAVIAIVIGMLWPSNITNKLFDMVVHIRTAIHTGDSGLIMTTALWSSVLMMIPNILIFIGIDILKFEFKQQYPQWLSNVLFLFVFVLIRTLPALLFQQIIEVQSLLFGITATLTLVHLSQYTRLSILPNIIIAFQVFFLVEWLNIMPAFDTFNFGNGDLTVSLKIAGAYLNNTTTMNTIGMTFIVVLSISSILTTLIFRLYVQNIKIVEENYDNAIVMKNMESKLMNNRIYQEINVLAHDLKTPLATVRGLSSLLVMTKDLNKLESYGNRIDQAVVKMSDMISGFLYGSSRKSILVEELINYVRSQIPTESDEIKMIFHLQPNMPKIFINKIRMARAIVNLITNAMMAPNTQEVKLIEVQAYEKDQKIYVVITDNGIGIEADKIDEIWKIGYSSKASSGLGLPFAKQTVEENDGEIMITSQFNHGTHVTITLPVDNEEEYND